jgi:hypothetical protein
LEVFILLVLNGIYRGILAPQQFRERVKMDAAGWHVIRVGPGEKIDGSRIVYGVV